MTFTTDEIAQAARTTLRGVRLWERSGLLGDVPRDKNGHRIFSAAHLARARIISAAQMAGMTIAEIRASPDIEIWRRVDSAIGFLVPVRGELSQPLIATRKFDL
jgi:hypothetical protein